MYELILPQDRIIEIFGHSYPNDREIDAYREMVWRQSVRYRRDLRRDILVRNVISLMDDIGFYIIFDYQIRERQIRFREEDFLATANMAGLYEFVRA